MEEKIVYFEAPGEENTAEVLRLVKERAKARGINKIILASTRGNTARSAADTFEESGLKMIVIPHQFGFGEEQKFPPELVTELEGKGHRVHFGTMLFHTETLYNMRTPRLMADLLRTFCQGMKVCHEMLMMACDGGLVEQGEKVIVVSGSRWGADTAVVATAAPSTRMPKLHIREIICMPL
ncbi:hypothetical protein ACFLW3_00530 [Chloroflexota bacterium]